MDFILSDQWPEYELLDSGDGRKLEKVGGVLLDRPEPQAVWTPAAASLWHQADVVFHAGGLERLVPRNAGQVRHCAGWEIRRPVPEPWLLTYSPRAAQGRQLVFRLHLGGSKQIGVFPEQAVNWDWCRGKIQAARRPLNVLNLFGYTGGATLAAASAGAAVCHVDAARGAVRGCRENLRLSGLEGRPVSFIVDDCLAFVKREVRRRRRYDGIIVDPPAFGRSGTGKHWKLENQLHPLLAECVRLLSDQPVFFVLTCHTPRPIGVSGLPGLSRPAVAGRDSQPGALTVGRLGIHAISDGRILPCGECVRWESGGNAPS